MKALVTGATGFIGSHMVDLLVRQGHEVTATDKPSSKRTYLNPKAAFIPADLTDAESASALFASGTPFDHVFHAAAIYDYSSPQDELDKANVDGTSNLLTAIKRHSPAATVVVWGSGSVYGDTGTEAATEEMPPNPQNSYEHSKAKQEEIALAFSDALKIIVIRPAAVYGPRGAYGASILIFMIAKGQIPCIIGDGKTPAFLVHVADVVNAALFLAENYDAVGAKIKTDVPRTKFIFNINDDSTYSNEELLLWAERCLRDVGRTDVQLLRAHCPMWLIKPIISLNTRWARKTGKRPPVERDLVEYLTRPILMSNVKIKSLGFRLRYPDAKIGIQETVAWYKEHGLI